MSGNREMSIKGAVADALRGLHGENRWESDVETGRTLKPTEKMQSAASRSQKKEQ